jgi:hypothetical protein
MVFLKPLLSAVTLISPIVAAQVAAPVPVRQATPYQSGLQAGLLAGVRLPLQPGQTTNYQNFAPVGQAPTYQNPAQAPASSGGLLGLGSVLSSTPVVGPLLNSLPLVGPLLTGVNSGVASPQPQPQPVSQVQPAPRPVTQPVTQPQPVSQVQPAPRPATQPVPQPQPVSQVQPAPRPATQPVTQPQPVSQVQPAPRPATQPVPQPQPAPQVQPAPRPAPAASPAPASTPPVTAAQVVSAIQFFTTRSLYIYQTTQAITLTDVTSLLQGRGNIAVRTLQVFMREILKLTNEQQLVSSVSDLASSLPAATSIFSRAPRFTAPADVNSIYNAYAEVLYTSCVKNTAYY